MNKIRILLVEDHALVRAGIRTLLEKQPEMEVIGEAADGREAIGKVQELRPDVVLMDLAMPVMCGLEATQHIKEQFPEVRILVLTMHEDDRYFFQALQAGVSGFIVKGALPAEFLMAVRAVAEGQIYLYPSLAQKLVDDHLARTPQDQEKKAEAGLTEREKQVLVLFSEGRTSKEIAPVLDISVHTVDRHRQNLMVKLDLHNRAELIHYAFRKGLLEIEP
jgi:two-component system response regulator NreC